MRYFGFDKCIKKYFSFSIFNDEDINSIINDDDIFDNYFTEYYVDSLQLLYLLMKLDDYNKLGTMILLNIDNSDDYIITNFKNTVLNNNQLESMLSNNNIVNKSYKNKHYKIIFFNLGYNIWFYMEWKPLYYRDSIWASLHNIYLKSSDLYYKNVTKKEVGIVKNKGYKNTKYILKNYKDDITNDSIFSYIKGSKYNLYIPSITELKNIYNIVSKYNLFNFLNIGKRLCFSSTCSEEIYSYTLQYNLVMCLSFNNGKIYNILKHLAEVGSIALLHL